MKTKAAIQHVGTTAALASMLRITPGAISQWGEYPPEKRQLQLERVTVGALKAEPGCLERLLTLETKAEA